MDDIKAIVETILKAKIIEGFHSSPEALDKLVEAALTKPVNADGSNSGYGSKVPYLDFLVGDTIRTAAAKSVREVVSEMEPVIKEQVRKTLNAESIVNAFTQALIGTIKESWNIKINFETEKK